MGEIDDGSSAAEPADESPWDTAYLTYDWNKAAACSILKTMSIPVFDSITFGGRITVNTQTGQVTIPPDMVPDQAASEFWAAVAGAFPRPVVAATTDTTEEAVDRRVAEVVQDLTAGRVVPKHVDQLKDAIARNGRDTAVGRAIGKPEVWR